MGSLVGLSGVKEEVAKYGFREATDNEGGAGERWRRG